LHSKAFSTSNNTMLDSLLMQTTAAHNAVPSATAGVSKSSQCQVTCYQPYDSPAFLAELGTLLPYRHAGCCPCTTATAWCTTKPTGATSRRCRCRKCSTASPRQVHHLQLGAVIIRLRLIGWLSNRRHGVIQVDGTWVQQGPLPSAPLRPPAKGSCNTQEAEGRGSVSTG
jgi:hypothetical protein